MIIKRVTIDDAQELLDIYSYYVEQTAVSFEYETPSLEEFKERIVNISSKYPYIKAEDNGKIVGYAYATTFKARKAYDWSVETTIYIDKNQRNKGIGRELYETLEKSLKNMGILNLNACIASPKEEDLRLSNDSEKFHEKLGFKFVGKFHDSGYKFGKWYDMIWMEKLISNRDNFPKDVAFGKWKI